MIYIIINNFMWFNDKSKVGFITGEVNEQSTAGNHAYRSVKKKLISGL